MFTDGLMIRWFFSAPSLWMVWSKLWDWKILEAALPLFSESCMTSISSVFPPPNPEQLQSSWVTTMSPLPPFQSSPLANGSQIFHAVFALYPESSLALIVSPRWCVPTMPAADILSLRYVTTSTIFLWCPLTIFTSTISTAAISMNCHALLATSYLFGGLTDRFCL